MWVKKVSWFRLGLWPWGHCNYLSHEGNWVNLANSHFFFCLFLVLEQSFLINLNAMTLRCSFVTVRLMTLRAMSDWPWRTSVTRKGNIHDMSQNSSCKPPLSHETFAVPLCSDESWSNLLSSLEIDRNGYGAGNITALWTSDLWRTPHRSGIVRGGVALEG